MRKNIKGIIASVCFAIPFLMGVTASADNTIDKPSSSLETSIARNAEKVQLEVGMGDTTPFAFIGLSTADNYVNIRKSKDTNSEVLGKLYKGGAVILEEMHGDWAKVTSGSVEGYISSEYLAVGEEIKDMLQEYSLTYAKINTITLRVREDKNADAATLGLVSEGESYRVLGQNDEWVKIDYNGKKGYVSKDYVSIYHEFESAVSIQEEIENQEAEEQARQQEIAARQNVSNSTSTTSKPVISKKPTIAKKPYSSNSTSSSASVQSSTVSSGTGSTLVAYAQQFVGNPYVWGGTSLTSGADCSGFTQAVFRNFGYSIPRTSRQQAKVGTSVSASNLQKGDLIFYASGGSVNHVAIYIGGGKIVHASNPKDGIKISQYNYRSPYAIRRVIK